MKRMIGLLTVLTLTIGMTVSVGATQAITFDDSGNGTVTEKETKKEEQPEEKKEEKQEEKKEEKTTESLLD